MSAALESTLPPLDLQAVSAMLLSAINGPDEVTRSSIASDLSENVIRYLRERDRPGPLHARGDQEMALQEIDELIAFFYLHITTKDHSTACPVPSSSSSSNSSSCLSELQSAGSLAALCAILGDNNIRIATHIVSCALPQAPARAKALSSLLTAVVELAEQIYFDALSADSHIAIDCRSGKIKQKASFFNPPRSNFNSLHLTLPYLMLILSHDISPHIIFYLILPHISHQLRPRSAAMSKHKIEQCTKQIVSATFDICAFVKMLFAVDMQLIDLFCSPNGLMLRGNGQELIRTLSLLYEKTLPSLSSTVSSLIKEAASWRLELRTSIDFAAVRCLEVFGMVLQYSSSLVDSGTDKVDIHEKSVTCLSWMDLLRSQCEAAATATSSLHSGRLFHDTAQLFNKDLRKVVVASAAVELCLSANDEAVLQQTQYMLGVLREVFSKEGAEVESQEDKDNEEFHSLSNDLLFSALSVQALSPSLKEEAKEGKSQSIELKVDKDAPQRAADVIKSIFPEYGEAFIVACLRAYNDDLDACLDGLISDNLPPALHQLDRRTRAVWVGKGATSSFLSDSVADKAFKAQVKAMAVETERQRERDFTLSLLHIEATVPDSGNVVGPILRQDLEYADDYDDQFDDPAPLSTSLALTTASSSDIQTRRSKDKSKTVVTWGRVSDPKRDKELEDMKRVNTLLKENEDEQAFWAAMRNTNHELHDENDDNDDDGDVEEVSGGAAKLPSQVQSQPQRRPHHAVKDKKGASHSNGEIKPPTSTKGPATGGGGVGTEQLQGKKKFRTKTFDRHHQKDKSIRKTGGGAI